MVRTANARNRFRVRVAEGGGESTRITDLAARINGDFSLAHPFQTEPFVALFNTDPSRPHFALIAEDNRGLAACWWGYFARHADGLVPRATAWVRSGPVVREDLAGSRDDVLALLLNELKRHLGRQGVGKVIFTSEALYAGASEQPCLSQGFRRRDLQTYLIDLSLSEEELLRRTEPAGRWATRKARQRGVTIEDAASDEDVLAYYRLYMETGSVPGSGPPSEEQFLSGFRRMREQDMGRIIVAKHEGRMVAGSFFPCHAGLAAQHQTALSAEGRKLNAGSLLLWESMLSFKQAGFSTLDLVSVEVAPPEGSREAGVREFKSKWGGALLDTPVYLYQSPAMRVWRTVAERIRDGKRLIARIKDEAAA